MQPDRDLDMKGLAYLLNVSREWVRKEVQAGRMPHHRRGKLIRFTPDDVDEIRASDARPAAPPPAPLQLLRDRAA